MNNQPDLVLLPGLDGTGLLFGPLLAELPGNIRTQVVAYPSDEHLSLEEYAAFVSGLLPSKGVVLLAESFSGLVALTLLARNQQNIRKVLFVASFAEPPRPLLLKLSPIVRWLGRAVHLAPAFLLRQFCLGKHARLAQLTLLREALATVQPSVLAHRLEVIAGTRFEALQSDTPCAYLQAKQDRLVPSSAGQWFRKQMGFCSVEAIDGPHFILQARPEECAKWILSQLHAGSFTA